MTNDHASIDPVDVLEELLAAASSNDPASLQVVQAGLEAIARRANHDTLAKLAAEDDAEERARLLDLLTFQRQRMVEAHHRFTRHIAAVAFAQGIGADPGSPACSMCGTTTDGMAFTFIDSDGTFVAFCGLCDDKAREG